MGAALFFVQSGVAENGRAGSPPLAFNARAISGSARGEVESRHADRILKVARPDDDGYVALRVPVRSHRQAVERIAAGVNTAGRMGRGA